MKAVTESSRDEELVKLVEDGDNDAIYFALRTLAEEVAELSGRIKLYKAGVIKFRATNASLEQRLAEAENELRKAIDRWDHSSLAEKDAEIARLREALEKAAKIAEGEVYHQRYRTWDWWPVNDLGGRGNVDREDQLAQHCDKIASAIRALTEKA